MALRIWLPLLGNTNNQGLSNCAIVNNGATVNNYGKIGKCYEFDGNDDFISVDYPQCFNNNWTYCCWIYNDDAGGRSIFYGDYSLPGAGGISIEKTVAEKVRFYWANGQVDAGFNNSTIAVGTWTHLALTYDGAKVRAYINGTQTDARNGVLPSVTKTGLYYIGRDSRTGATAFKGKMNDFRIYDECLNQKQIKNIAKGLICHYKFDTPHLENTNNLVPENIYNYTSIPAGFNNGIRAITWFQNEKCFSVTTTENDARDGFICQETAACTNGTVYTYSGYIWIPTGYTWTISMRQINGGAGYFYQDIIGNNQWQYFSYTFTANNNTSGKIQGFEAENYPTVHTIYLKKLQLEQKDHATPFINGSRNVDNYYDCSGNGYIASKLGTLTFNTDSPRYDGSITFGSGALVNTLAGAALASSNNFTINGWFYYVSGKTYYASAENYNTSVCLENARFFVYPANGSGAKEGFWNATPNTWQMVTLVYDSEALTLTLYVDGKYEKQLTIQGTIYPNNTLNIGGRQGSSSFRGSMSDFRIYCMALSAEDIKELYQTSALIDKENNLYTYKLKEE